MARLPNELEARIQYLENPLHQGEGFRPADWGWLIGLGIIGPILLLIWGAL